MAETNKKDLFIEKNLKKASEPEQLDTYLKVTSMGPWFVLIVAGLVAAALIIWAFTGRIYTVLNGAGYCRNGTLTCYFPKTETELLSVGDTMRVGNIRCKVKSIDTSLFQPFDIPYDILYLLPEADWYSTVEIEADLKDGLYTTQHIISEEPISFLAKGSDSR